MIILLYVVLGVMAVAIVTTIFAIVTAKDGYEDETSFHFCAPAGAPDATARPALAGRLPLNDAASAFVSETARPAARELPSEMLGAS